MAVLTHLKSSVSQLGRRIFNPSNPMDDRYLFEGGLFYVQYGASTAYGTTATEGSILNNTSTTVVTGYPQGQGNYPTSTLYIPPNGLTIGTVLQGQVTGIITNTGTPNLTLRIVLDAVAGTVTYALATTGAVATPSSLSNSLMSIQWEGVVTATGISGSITSSMLVFLGTTTFAAVAPASAVTVDTTKGYYIDALATWGTSSSSNTLTTEFARFGILG